MNTVDILRDIVEPLGISPRIFSVDYRDKDNNYYHAESVLVGNADDDFIVDGLVKDYAANGFIAYGVVEILNGYSSEELQALTISNPTEAVKHMRPVYYDPAKEKAPHHAT